MKTRSWTSIRNNPHLLCNLLYIGRLIPNSADVGPWWLHYPAFLPLPNVKKAFLEICRGSLDVANVIGTLSRVVLAASCSDFDINYFSSSTVLHSCNFLPRTLSWTNILVAFFLALHYILSLFPITVFHLIISPQMPLHSALLLLALCQLSSHWFPRALCCSLHFLSQLYQFLKE